MVRFSGGDPFDNLIVNTLIKVEVELLQNVGTDVKAEHSVNINVVAVTILLVQ